MRKAVIVIALLSIALSMFPAGAQQQQPPAAGPLTLPDINLLLRRRVGRDMTEGDIAAKIDRDGIAFDPAPEAMSRLRANGAHAHLINAVKRAGERLAATNGATITVTGPGKPDPFIEETRKNVRDYVEELPDFICQQEITRYYDLGTGAWDRIDTLVYELTYNNKRESYKPLNSVGRPVTRALEQSGGAYSTGDWATALSLLFMPETAAIFKAAGKEKLGQRQTAIYDFTVPLERSKLQIAADVAAPIKAGYSGSVWIDVETKNVLRIEQAADDLPANYPVTQSENSIDYDMVKLRGIDVEFLLPTRAEFVIGDRRKRHFSRNQIYFKFYRKFETDIKVVDEPAQPVIKPPSK